MCLLFAFAYRCIARPIPSLIPFSMIDSILISVNTSSFNYFFYKHACHANPDTDKK